MLLLLILILFIFSLHNYISEKSNRILTFTALNYLKVFIRLLFISNLAIYYFIAFIPFEFIKLMHYLKSKNLVTVDDFSYQKIIQGIYLGFFISILFIDDKLLFVCFPFYIVHSKRILIFLKIKLLK